MVSFNFGLRAERFALGPPEQDFTVNILEGAVRSGKTWCLHPKAIYCCRYNVGGRKVITGLGVKHKAALKQARPGEQVPLRDKDAMETWLNALFYVNRDWDEGVFDQIFIPEAVGKKLNNIFDNQLRPIRDKIAHGILDSGEFLLLDKAEDRAAVSRWLPLLRCLARRVMKNDFKDYLEFLSEDGTMSE